PIALGEAFLGFLELLLQLRHVLAAFVGELAQVLGVLLLFLQFPFEPGDLLARGGYFVGERVGLAASLGLSSVQRRELGFRGVQLVRERLGVVAGVGV